MYPTLLAAFNKTENIVLFGTCIWACFFSDYIRQVIFSKSSGGEGEALIAFGLWGLLLWWVSKRYGDGWNVYWFAFALASFALFADAIDAAFGGVLGLRG